MAKRKRKVTEVTGKKNKKLKKVSAEERVPAPEATRAAAGARPEVGAPSRRPHLGPCPEAQAGGVCRWRRRWHGQHADILRALYKQL